MEITKILTDVVIFFIGPHALQQITSQLNPIPEEMLAVSAELMARRIELLNLLRGKHRSDRSTYVTVSKGSTLLCGHQALGTDYDEPH